MRRYTEFMKREDAISALKELDSTMHCAKLSREIHALNHQLESASAHKVKNQAWDRLISMLEKGLALGGDKFNRDELYDC
jgi:hypothetical protein